MLSCTMHVYIPSRVALGAWRGGQAKLLRVPTPQLWACHLYCWASSAADLPWVTMPPALPVSATAQYLPAQLPASRASSHRSTCDNSKQQIRKTARVLHAGTRISNVNTTTEWRRLGLGEAWLPHCRPSEPTAGAKGY